MILDSGQALVIVYPHDRFYLFLLKLQILDAACILQQIDLAVLMIDEFFP